MEGTERGRTPTAGRPDDGSDEPMVSYSAVLGGVVFVLLGVGGLWQGSNRLRRTGKISADDATSIRDLRPGTWTQVRGTARPAESEPLPAQIAGGAGFVVHTELAGRGGAQGEGPGVFLRQLHAVPFELEDGTGTVRIEPPDDTMGIPDVMSKGISSSGGDVETTKSEYLLDETVVENSESIPEEVREWATTQGRNFDGFPNSAYKFKQGVVEPGDSVVVYGKVRRYPDGNADSPDLRVDGDEEPERFILTDSDGGHAESSVRREEIVRFGFALLSILVGLVFVGVGVTEIGF